MKDESLIKAYNIENYLIALQRAHSGKPGETINFDDDNESVDRDRPKYNGSATKSIFVDESASETKAPVAIDTATAMPVIDANAIVQARKELERAVDDKIANTKLSLSDDAKAAIKQIAKDEARARFDEWLPPRRIEVSDTKTGEVRDLGLQHFKFDILLRACAARGHNGHRLNIWLTGPTGSGKTTGAENVAKALDLNFDSDGSLDADYKVMGFRDAHGNIISTAFLRIYAGGGIYVADEIDNWMPSALLSLNAALANGWVSTPGGIIKRHPDCIVIACANTWGLGATNEYVGRTKLDAASLNRFLPKIDWPIDEKLEMALAQGQGQDGIDWCQTVQRYRAAAKAQGLHVIISPRDTFAGIALLAQDFTVQEVIDMTFAAGLKPEQRTALGIDQASIREVPTRRFAS